MLPSYTLKTPRIIVFGATGSGKTTLAKELSKVLSTPSYSTDDFVYKKKWKEKYSDKERNSCIRRISKMKKWIVEGVHDGEWLIPLLKKSNVIILLDINKFLLWYRVTKRYLLHEKRHYRGLQSLARMIYWATVYKKDSYIKHTAFIKKYGKTTFIFRSFRDKKRFIDELTSNNFKNPSR